VELGIAVRAASGAALARVVVALEHAAAEIIVHALTPSKNTEVPSLGRVIAYSAVFPASS
jgi:hypothetical protein